MEVGTKQLDGGNKKEAYDFFTKAYNLYSLFWGINMKILPVADIEKIDDDAINEHDTEKKSIMKKMGEMVQKVIDCCIE